MITYAALLDGVLPDILVNLKNNTENGTTIDIISAFDAVFEAVGPVLEEINKATPEDIYGLYKNFPWDGLWMIFNGAGEGRFTILIRKFLLMIFCPIFSTLLFLIFSWTIQKIISVDYVL
jgi:hypothetical protein